MKMKLLIGTITLTATVIMTGCGSSASKLAPAGSGKDFFKNKRTEARVDSLMKLMTLDEKIGQLVLYSSSGTITGPTLPKNVEESIKNGTCGNIFNAHDPAYNRGLQKMALEETRLGIPLLLGYDVIHGMKTTFPINLGLSATWEPALAEQMARVSAREAIAAGVNWTFSPMVDITRDPRWGRVSEGSGEDTYLGCLFSAAVVRGYQCNDLSSDSTLLACVKHFAAYGAPQAGRDYHTVDMTERTLRETYLPPYKAAVDAGVGSVMASFNEIDATPATASKFLMDQVLRKEWGFNGFVVTDFTGINELIPHGVARDSMHAGELAINAGINMDMQSDAYHKHLKKSVQEGRVSEKQIDEMCRQVLRMKFELGLFSDPYKYSDTTAYKAEFFKPANLAAARNAAKRSFVLLKNSNNALPIATGKRIALIGPFADDQREMLGSWIGQAVFDSTITVRRGLEERFGAANVIYAKGCSDTLNDRSGFGSAVAAAFRSDVAVMVVGLSSEWSGEATSLTSIQLPQIQRELIEAVVSTGKPVVLLISSGRPMDLTMENAKATAILQIWHPGTEAGHAIADVLSGDYNPAGKLTMTFPRNVGQVPIFYDVKNTGRPYTPGVGEQHYVSRYLTTENSPLFPFGYGLSYTTFNFSDLKLDKTKMNGKEAIAVSVTLKNMGTRDGEEVAQFYIQDVVGSVTRPMRQLKGFEKVMLKAGESKTLNFTITPEMLAFYRQDMSWGTEAGQFNIFVGGSSDTPLAASFELID